MITARRIPLVLFVGALLMQVAWIIALPPFAGVDEFDHAYRASSVADGHWAPGETPAVLGRGSLLRVDADIVDAAGPQCDARTYTGPDNCHPVRVYGDGTVEVASGAAAYNPAYYWVVGTAASPWDGSSSLYVMRLVTAALCSLLLALTAWVLGLWARTRWPLLGLMVATTPVVAYSTSIVAPNGIEMCAALLVWASLLGLTRTGLDQRTQRVLLWACLPGALILTTVRSLGPLWLLLAVVTSVAMLGRERLHALLRLHWRSISVVSGVVLAATVASCLWIVGAKPNTREEIADLSNPVVNSLVQTPLWFFQSIAAFPSRTDPAPLPVYLCYIVVFAGAFILALKAAGRRGRMVLGALVVVNAAVAIGVNAFYYSTEGPTWQGRYGLPLAFGLAMVCGLVLDQRRRKEPSGRLVLGAAALIATAQVTGVVAVNVKQIDQASHIANPLWIAHWPVLTAALMLLGWAAWTLVALPPGWTWRTAHADRDDVETAAGRSAQERVLHQRA